MASLRLRSKSAAADPLHRIFLRGMFVGCLIGMTTIGEAADRVPLPTDQAAAARTAELSASARDLLARLRPSIVQIRSFFGGNSAEAEHGTGFAVAPDGVLLTNYHVIA